MTRAIRQWRVKISNVNNKNFLWTLKLWKKRLINYYNPDRQGGVDPLVCSGFIITPLILPASANHLHRLLVVRNTADRHSVQKKKQSHIQSSIESLLQQQ